MENELGVSNQISSIAIPWSNGQYGCRFNCYVIHDHVLCKCMWCQCQCIDDDNYPSGKCASVSRYTGIPGGAIASFAALATMAGLPAGVMGVYISINTLCDMGATCVNVIGDMAGCVVLQEKIDLE